MRIIGYIGLMVVFLSGGMLSSWAAEGGGARQINLPASPVVTVKKTTNRSTNKKSKSEKAFDSFFSAKKAKIDLINSNIAQNNDTTNIDLSAEKDADLLIGKISADPFIPNNIGFDSYTQRSAPLPKQPIGEIGIGLGIGMMVRSVNYSYAHFAINVRLDARINLKGQWFMYFGLNSSTEINTGALESPAQAADLTTLLRVPIMFGYNFKISDSAFVSPLFGLEVAPSIRGIVDQIGAYGATSSVVIGFRFVKRFDRIQKIVLTYYAGVGLLPYFKQPITPLTHEGYDVNYSERYMANVPYFVSSATLDYLVRVTNNMNFKCFFNYDLRSTLMFDNTIGASQAVLNAIAIGVGWNFLI